jgi:hypothetical protein
VWLLLAVIAVGRAVGQMVTLRQLAALVGPQVLSGALFLLYNFAITGSARPDALFLAWGPGGVSTARMGQGLIGLLLDARYGLLPYVPIFLLAAGALGVSGPGARALRGALPVAAAYYVTVASADNWSGAVCNLGRYVMPAIPFLLALVAAALARTGNRPGIRALALALAGWTGLLAFMLWRDPDAANDGAVLLSRSAFADGNVYIPNLFLRSWSDAAPGLLARVLVWVGLLLLIALAVRRVDGGRGGGSATAALVALTAVTLVAALALERWPTPYRSARFPDAVPAGPGATAFLGGAVVVRNGRALARPGHLDLLVRSRGPMDALVVRVSGAALPVPLRHLTHLVGRRGVEEDLYRGRLRLETGGEVELGPAGPLMP